MCKAFATTFSGVTILHLFQPVSDLEHGNADDDQEKWIVEPLDEERQGAESDGDSSNHSQNSSSRSQDSANHSQGSANHSQGSGSAVDDGKHSLLQYAMTHFRGAEERSVHAN